MAAPRFYRLVEERALGLAVVRECREFLRIATTNASHAKVTSVVMLGLGL